MIQDIARVLISEEQLKTRIAELGKQLAAEYEDKEPIFVGVLSTSLRIWFGRLRSAASMIFWRSRPTAPVPPAAVR